MNYLAYGVIALTILLVMILVLRTDILKDSSALQDRKPYSLARTQLLLWTVIIFCCLVYLWGGNGTEACKGMTSDLAVGKTALILLGVSAGTTILGRTIDESDKKNLDDGKVERLHQNDPSGGFLWDILSDNDGISIHRLQNVLFTLLLMIDFIIRVLSDCKMPEFQDTLLILSGVSAGGYLGVKINENK